MIRALFSRRPDPEPEDEDDDDFPKGPPIGVHPLYDVMALQNFMLRQQRDIWRHFGRLYRNLARLTIWYVILAFLWAIVAFGPLVKLIWR